MLNLLPLLEAGNFEKNDLQTQFKMNFEIKKKIENGKEMGFFIFETYEFGLNLGLCFFKLDFQFQIRN